jgi:hypothetical protein
MGTYQNPKLSVSINHKVTPRHACISQEGLTFFLSHISADSTKYHSNFKHIFYQLLDDTDRDLRLDRREAGRARREAAAAVVSQGIRHEL